MKSERIPIARPGAHRSALVGVARGRAGAGGQPGRLLRRRHHPDGAAAQRGCVRSPLGRQHVRGPPTAATRRPSCARSRSRSTRRASSSTGACRPARSGGSSPRPMTAAKQICGGAIVGSGHVGVRVRLRDQAARFTFKAPLLAFNAKPRNGHQRILAQAYGARPAVGLRPHLQAPQASRRLRHRDQHDAAALGSRLGLRHPLRHDAAAALHVSGPAAQLHQRQLRGAGGLPGRPSTHSPEPATDLRPGPPPR